MANNFGACLNYETYTDSLCNLDVPCHNNIKPHKQLTDHVKVSPYISCKYMFMSSVYHRLASVK